MTATKSLTREQIQAMPAGRELDQLVAAVIGQGWEGGNPISGFTGRWPWPPPFSTDIAAAWQVVGWLHERWGKAITLSGDSSEWHCTPLGDGDVYDNDPYGHGDTAPLAVCRAALLEAIKS